MAKQLAVKGLVLLTIFVGLLTAEGMNLVLTNNMNADAGVTCRREGTGDFSYVFTVFPGRSIVFPVNAGSDNYEGWRYHCAFSTNGKPRTVLEVFVGTGGAANSPCNCAGAVCPWSITADGFFCSGYSHGWGN